jgi:hypothetical protein
MYAPANGVRILLPRFMGREKLEKEQFLAQAIN